MSEIAEKILNASGWRNYAVEDGVDAGVDGFLPVLHAQGVDVDAVTFAEALRPPMARLTDRLQPRLVAEIDRTLSPDEAAAVLAFLESPAGRVWAGLAHTFRKLGAAVGSEAESKADMQEAVQAMVVEHFGKKKLET